MYTKKEKHYLVDQFNNNQLQYVTKSVDLVYTGTKVIQSAFLRRKVGK